MLRVVRPGVRRRDDLDVPDPYYGGDQRVRDRARPGRGGLPRAARLRCGEPRRRRARGHRARRPVGGAGRRRRHQRGLARGARRRAGRRSSRPARTSRRASTPPRRPACAGWPSPARSASRRCSASATPCSCSSGCPRAAAATRRALGAGLRRDPRRGRARLRRHAARRRHADRARSCCPTTPHAGLGRRSTPSGACCPLAPARRGSRRDGTRPSSACATAWPSWPGRPSRRRVCTATCGAATCCGTRDGPAVADRPRRLRRPPRGRPGDAAAVRLARAGASSPPTRSAGRWPTATRSAWSCGSCSRCSCTPRCSAAATAAAVHGPPRATHKSRSPRGPLVSSRAAWSGCAVVGARARRAARARPRRRRDSGLPPASRRRRRGPSRMPPRRSASRPTGTCSWRASPASSTSSTGSRDTTPTVVADLSREVYDGPTRPRAARPGRRPGGSPPGGRTSTSPTPTTCGRTGRP